MAEIETSDIRRAAMDLLARREHARCELEQKLSRRFSDCELLRQQLDILAEENLQSDQRFTESFVRQRVQRGQGPVRIRQELRQRRIDDHLADSALSAGRFNWFEIAEDALQKKFAAAPVNEQDRARRYRFLMQRGFHAELCRELVMS